MSQAQVLAEGLYFGEGPRWHEGRLWFSDFYDHAVKSVDESGNVRLEHQLTDQPSGLGWLPTGQLLVVSMAQMTVLRLEGEEFVLHADLNGLAKHLCNDMVVDAHGRAWVGNFGFDLDKALRQDDVADVLANPPTTNLVRVDPDGSTHVVASGMRFPNGMVITPDGKTFIVAETLGLCLTAFDIEANGELSNRRRWADLGGRAPDGICLNAEGNIWVANALAPECVLVAPGGDVLDTVTTSQNCYACMLGGEADTTLFIATAKDSHHAVASEVRSGKIEICSVAVAGAGWP